MDTNAWRAPLVYSLRGVCAGALLAVLCASAHVVAVSAQVVANATAQPQHPDTSQVQQALQGLSIPFEANAGQFDERVAFAGRTFAGLVYVTREGQIVYSLPGAEGESREGQPGWSLAETLVGAQALEPRGGEQAATRVSRFTGPASYQAATYRNVLLGQAWPGIEVELAARGNNIEKLFHVAPHADAQRIQLRLAGALDLRLSEAGELIASTGHGDVAYTAPVAFQEVDGQRIDVPVQYALNAQNNGYGFLLGAYDRSRPLVIDPLLQSTYLGGRGGEQIRALAIDSATGDVLVGGQVTSSNIGDFPGAAGGAQPGGGGGTDGFVARLSGDLKTLRQSTYLGGDGVEDLTTIAIDSVSGDVLVGGTTTSVNFPGTTDGAQPAWITEGLYGSAGFLTRLSGDLKTLRQSTYLSGNAGSNNLYAIAIDAVTGDVLAGGRVGATGLPGTEGGAQPTTAGGQDGFVTRLAGDLKSLRQSSYLGGNGRDIVHAISIDTATGDVLLAGRTDSANFPAVANAAQPLKGAGDDGFVARLSGDLKSLRQSTYLGGNGDDWVNALAIDGATGEVVVAGQTYSSDLPGAASGAQAMLNGYSDGFVARLSGSLKQIRQSTYLGGSDIDSISSLAIDAATGDVFVGGRTFRDFPGTTGGAQPVRGADDEGFVARLSGDLKSLQQSTYLGSTYIDYVGALAIDAATGHVLVAGRTSGGGSFPGTAGGAQSARGGGDDGFVSRLTNDLKAFSPQAISFPPQGEQEFVAGGSFAIDLPATANSGLPVSYASTTPDICTVSGNTVTMVSAGICTVVASQGGNADWEPAADVVQDIVIEPPPLAAQSITFPPQAQQEFVAGASFAIDPPAVASSGLPVSYASSTPAVCTVAGGTVTMVAAGTCTVVASQGGDAQWGPAQDVAQHIVLAPGDGNGGGTNPDPGPGPGPVQPTPVPALGPLGLALLSLLAGGMGCRLRPRRR